MKASLLYVPPKSPNLTSTDGDHSYNHPTGVVKQVEVHPSLPLTASIDENNRVVVLDYIRNEVLVSFTEEDLLQWVLTESASKASSSSQANQRRIPHGRRTPLSSTSSRHSRSNSFSTHATDNLTLSTAADSSVASKDMLDAHTTSVSLSSSSGLKINTGMTHAQNSPSLSRLTPLSRMHTPPASNTNNSFPIQQQQLQQQQHTNTNIRIGFIRQIRFFDRHTTFWATHSQRTNHPGQDSNESYNYSRIPPQLIVQCDYRIIIVPLKFRSKRRNAVRHVHSFRIASSSGLTIPPTCMAEATSPTLLMAGSTYGTIIFYDTEKQSVIKTIQLHKKVDAITQLLLINYGPQSTPEKSDVSSSTTTTPNVIITAYSTIIRVMAVCSSGNAYLLSIVISSPINDDNDIEENGNIISLQSILGQIEGLWSSVDTSATAVGMVGTASSLSYDADRDFLIGILAGGKMVGTWDLSSIPLEPTSSTKKTGIPILKPFLVMKLSGFEYSGSTSGSSSSSSSGSSMLVVPSMQHSCFPDTVLACWTGNKMTGEISVVINSLAFRKSMIIKPEVYFTCSLNAFKEHFPSKIKIFSMGISRFRNHNIVCGTNVGIIVLSVEDNTVSKCISGARHISLNEESSSGAILLVEGSSLFAATLDSSTLNPVGPLNLQNPILVYKSPELSSYSSSSSSKKSANKIRLPPRLFMSPSRDYICLFWHAESRYEILHVPSLIKFQKDSGQYPPPVDFGLNVVSFAWVGKDDAFVILHSDAASDLHSQKHSSSKMGSGGSTPNEKKQTFSLKREIKSKIGRKSDSNSKKNNNNSTNPTSDINSGVELKILIGVDTNELDTAASVAAATATSLGEMMIRGGGRPTTLFGGPVLCIGSCPQSTSDTDAEAYFYSTSRSISLSDSNNGSNVKASSFMTIGPSLPYPDLVVWSDDNKFCCVCAGSRVAIYLSQPPEFTLIGTALLAPNEVDAKILSAKFIHNVLYCTSRASVQCIFFGPVDSSNDRVTDLDSFVIVSTDAPLFSQEISNGVQDKQFTLSSLSPQPFQMVLGGEPQVLMYFCGSLLVSTPSGIKGINLSHPLLRIGILITAGHKSRAQLWFDAVDPQYHESLARFLERRRVPELAVALPGLSLESVIDLCIKYTLTSTLEDLIEQHGLSSIRQIDTVRGGYDGGHSTVECVGAFLLSQGKAELVRRMASECIVSGDEARKEALFLASLLLSVDSGDAKRLVKRALGGVKGKAMGSNDSESSSWPIGNYVRNHIF